MSLQTFPAPGFEAGRPQPLFRAPITGDITTYRNHCAVAADGQRFIVDSADRREPITVVVNWTALLTRSRPRCN